MDLESLPHLFVEGKTDEYFIVQVLKHSGLFAHAHDGKKLNPSDYEKVNIIVQHVGEKDGSSGSRTELLKDISRRIASPKPRAIGYVIDADDPQFTNKNLKSTWQAVRQELGRRPAEVLSSADLPASGFVGRHAQTQTSIGIWIMPDNVRDGSLEDFIRELTDLADPLWPHADRSTKSAKKKHSAPYELKDFKKAVLHAWLAWQIEPGMTFATAFAKHRFRADTVLAASFVEWVKRLIA